MTDRRFVESTPEGFVLSDPRVYVDFADIPGAIMIALPDDLSLRDVSWHGAFKRPDGYWPIEYAAVDYDPATSAVDWSYALDVDRKVVTAAGVVVSILPPAVPRVLGRLEFTALVQHAGGMTDAMLVAAYKDPAFEAFWIKFQLSSAVERDHLVTLEALMGLEASGYLPNGAQAVVSAWPSI